MHRDSNSLCQEFLESIDTMDKSLIVLVAACIRSLKYYEDVISSLNDDITEYHSKNKDLQEQLAALQAETKEEP